jgi:RNA-binding protein 39
VSFYNFSFFIHIISIVDKCTLVLQEMLSQQDLVECTEAELKDEIAEECRKYGVIQEIQIHGGSNNPQIFVYVRYSDAMGALKARDSLNGRFFAQRRIVATITEVIPPRSQ